MSIRIGILGTRGIPNHYGGFERLAEKLSVWLVNMGHEVFVYNSHNHFYQEKKWKDVHVVHCYDPEYLVGTSGQFIYDLNCILDARKRKFDVMLVLGYTSSSLWHWLLPRESVVIYNMDGMEWKRTKYSNLTRGFLRYAEKLAVQPGNFYISDSPAIQSYLHDKYALESEYIAYGAEIFANEDETLLREYAAVKYNYFLLVARMEPENNIEMILDGFHRTASLSKFIVVGNTANSFGKHLVNKFKDDARVHFIGAVYDEQKLHSLRLFSQMYFHGHSTGGTNPSLLEAMSSKAFIVAHDNIFNRNVLDEDAFYFGCATDVQDLVEGNIDERLKNKMVSDNSVKIREKYNWSHIFIQYEKYMLQCLYIHNNERNILHKRYSY